ncbi:hypothetical protein [Arthrobacter sp. ISL-30]|uniref:hypothetical protein n=1 Tax=Arthrobacter sp. ISL-30 TaxID=2819109 RepID=UPI002035D43F|nr:hypothetical protein [Arthrobacter sp. ISL-30]
MDTAHGGPSGADGPPGTSVSASNGSDVPAVDVPVRADGVQLIGESKGSGYREPPSLVRRADGQTLALTRLLYLVLEAADGSRSVDRIAETVSTRFGKLVSAGNVRKLVESELLPLGLLRLADGSQPEVKKADPLLGLRFRYTVTDPERTRKLTAPFAALFNPLIVVAVTAVFLWACWWVLMVQGLGSATYDAFANPGLLLLVFAITILSAGFHEFGHAAGAQRGGSTPGAMGAGLYLMWPAFYTDVTDSYRLGRFGRLRTDLGGLYFNAIVAVAIMAVWWASRFDALLLVVLTQILQMVRQLLPLLRFDGYHILADATGVPDLFQRIKPTLLGLLPGKHHEPKAQELKPWARAVVILWVLVTVPLLLISIVLMVFALPRLLGTAWSSCRNQYAMLAGSLADGNILDAAARFLAIAAAALPVLAILYLLVRLARQLLTGLWARTRGKKMQRATATATVIAAVAGLAWAWWPDAEAYRPVQPYERGTLADAASAIIPLSAPGLREGETGRTIALWPTGTQLPTREKPQLSMVLVPQEDGTPAAGSRSDAAGSDSSQDQGDSTPPSWVFPFDKPPAPESDGNQALAVNTTDGSVVYDVAFALVWAEDGQTVDTRNEAYAFANCSQCTAVAVGFQVVLIVGQADVIVPENLAAASNYCIECLTYALASQLVLTLDGPLSEDGMSSLSALWAEIAEFGRTLDGVPLSEIQARLNAYKERIVAIIRGDPSAIQDSAVQGGTTTTGTPSQAPGNPGPAPAISPGSDAGTGSGSDTAPGTSTGTGTTGTASPAPAGPAPTPVAPAPTPVAPATPMVASTAPAVEPVETPAPGS